MRELAIIDNFGNTSFEIALQENPKILDIGLFSHIGNQSLVNGLQKWGFVFVDIELFVVESD